MMKNSKWFLFFVIVVSFFVVWNTAEANFLMIQQASSTHPYLSPQTSATSTLSAATANNLIVAAIASDKSAGTYTVPSGFTRIGTAYDGASISCDFAYKIATGGETDIVWTYTTSQESAIWAAEYSGLVTSSVLDASAVANSNNVAVSSQTSGTTVATTQADELAIAFFGIDTDNSADLTRSWTNGFTALNYINTTDPLGTAGLGLAQKTLSTTGTQETTASWTGSYDGGSGAGVDQVCAGIATFKVAPTITNQPPQVSAGPDQTITLPATASLDGIASDDGLPNKILTMNWSKVSGPGTVTFADASAVDTTAGFSAAGTYVLRLTANDGALSMSDDLTVGVGSAWSCNTQSGTQSFVVPGVSVGTLSAADVNEASGLAVSRKNPGVLWTHNDNDNQFWIAAINRSGTILGKYDICANCVVGVDSYDPEDIAIGPGPVSGVDYLYYADIGANKAGRATQAPPIPMWVYRIEEPAVDPLRLGQGVNLAVAGKVKKFYIQFPTSPAPAVPSNKDMETVMADPISGDLFFVTKRTTPNKVYRLAFADHRRAAETGEILILEYVTDLHWGSNNGSTGGDISPDGSLIAVRRYTSDSPNVSIWYRAPGMTVMDAFRQSITRVPYPPCDFNAPFLQSEPQGEALGFEADGSGFVTVSENATVGAQIPIWRYARRDTTPFAINVSVTGAGGTITPTGNVSVNHGADQTFIVTPSTGYQVANVLIDGLSVGAVTTYTFINVIAPHTITASFSLSKPAAPSNFTVTVVSSNRIDLSWIDNATNEIGFHLYRWTASGTATGSWTYLGPLVANITGYVDSNLQPFTRYRYAILAYNRAGYSATGWIYSPIVTTLAP